MYNSNDGNIQILEDIYCIGWMDCAYMLIPYKTNFLFVGHRQTVQTQVRRHRTRRLIRVSTVAYRMFI